MPKPQKNFQAIATELAVEAAGHRFPRLSQVGAGWIKTLGGPRRAEMFETESKSFSVPVPTRGYGIFLLDVLVTDDRQLVLIEANGSNAALSSATRGEDDKRARHMFLTFMQRGWAGQPGVALLAYTPNLLHIPEFFMRAGRFASLLSQDLTVRLGNERDELGPEDVAVICGPIPDLASNCQSSGEQLYYKGRPILFGTNPNLFPELVRQEIANRDGRSYCPRPDFQHEGAATPIVHDKGLQQELCDGTGFKQLKSFEVSRLELAHDKLKEAFRDADTWIGKINAGSGGAGIEVFSRSFSDSEISSRLNAIVDAAIQKYGDEAERVIYPLRFFEFAESTKYVLQDGPRLWDLRLQCLVYPGYVDVTPCAVRLCPEPFNNTTYARETVIANLSGRKPTLRYIRSPFAMRRSDESKTVLEAMKIDNYRLSEIVEACARWCERALATAESWD